MFLRTILNGLFALGLFAVAPRTEGSQEPPARRLSAIVGVAVEEYAKGVDAAGRLISSTELEEAAGFLRDAQDVAKRLTAPNADAIRLLLDSLATAAGRHEKPSQLVALSKKLTVALGTDGALELPTTTVDIARGRAIFEQHCIECHGPTGAGDGPKSKELNTVPAAIGTAATMHGVTPAFAYRVVSVGIVNTRMVSWSSVLSSDERWAVVRYITSLRADDRARRHGEALLKARCARCGTAAAPEALDFPWQAERSDDDIAASIAAGDPAVGVSDGASLTPTDVAALIAAMRADVTVRQAQTATAGNGQPDPRDAARATIRLLDDALSAARNGRAAEAGDKAFDAYIAFEPLEGPARMRDPSLVASMERHFADFKGAVKTGDLATAAAQRALVEQGMPRIVELSSPTRTWWGVFVESFIIIVREGFEAILVIGAVVAFLIKTGNRKRLREIWMGAMAGLAASVLLAVVLRTVLSAVPASREIIEGATMLVAVVVLFSVSYWLLSKVEGANWQKFIRDKVNAALSNGGSSALAFVAFLAVFREGAETALFYQALFTRSANVLMPVSLGLLCGFAALTVIFILFYRFGVKVPLRPFFAVTSGLLYYMALVFAGKGIKELQEGNALNQTWISGFPTIDMLGIYPTVETLVAQGVLVALLLFALWKTFVPSDAADDVVEAATVSHGTAPIPPELAARLAELQATATRLQDRVATLEAATSAATSDASDPARPR